MPYRHTLRIRYAECDMQGIVFNAHYLAYCDDAFGAWVEAAMPGAMSFVGNDGSFDVMVKQAVVTWHGAVRFGETRRPRLLGRRDGGRTSFDVALRAARWPAPSASTSSSTYVNVTPGTHTPAPVADDVKSALGAESR